MFNKDYSQYLRNNINQNQLENQFIQNSPHVVNTNNLFPIINTLNQKQIVNNNNRNDFGELNILNLMRNMSLESPNPSLDNFQSLGQPLRPFVQSGGVGNPLNSQLHNYLVPKSSQHYNNIFSQNSYGLGINNSLNNINNNNFGHQGNINNNNLNNLYHNINNDDINLNNILEMNRIPNISPEQLNYLKNKEKVNKAIAQLNINNNNLFQNTVNNFYNQHDRPDDNYLNYNDYLNIYRLGGTNNFINNIQNINKILEVNKLKNNINKTNELKTSNNINFDNLNLPGTQNLITQINTNKNKNKIRDINKNVINKKNKKDKKKKDTKGKNKIKLKINKDITMDEIINQAVELSKHHTGSRIAQKRFAKSSEEEKDKFLA